MKRWDYLKRKAIESKNIDDFLDEIADVCKKYGFSFSYDEGLGCFLVEEYDSHNIKKILLADVWGI